MALLLTPMPAQYRLQSGPLSAPADPWLLPSKTGRSTVKKASPALAGLMGTTGGGGGWWAERPEHTAVALPLLSFSKQKCTCRTP